MLARSVSLRYNTPMNILVLDDMEIRHKGFKKIFAGTSHRLFHAYSFNDAQHIILNNKIEMACLDHDLGDEDPETASFYYDDYGNRRFYNGAHFAFWLSNQEGCIPSRIVIHSHNPKGAKRMEAYLRPHVQMILVREFEM